MQFEITTVHKNSKSSIYLDLLRGLSAVGVMLFHERLFLFKGYGDALHGHPLFTIFLALTSRGHQFVMVFFVLSGYLVGSSVLKSMQDGRWSWKIYLTNRLVRLWIVLIPALILAYGWARLQVHFYGPAIYSVGGFNWRTFFGNIFFLQQVTVTNFADNSTLWSLSYEFWYYILFPCVVMVLFDKNILRRILYLCVLVVIYNFLTPPIIEYFSVWLLGVIVALIPTPDIKNVLSRRLIVVSSLFIACLSFYIDKLMSPNDQSAYIRADLVVGVGCALLVYSITRYVGGTTKKRKLSFPAILAGCSYTLYLVHYPVLNLVGAWMNNAGFKPSAKSFVIYIIIALGMFAYAYIVSRLTEAHTGKLKRLMLRMTIAQWRNQKPKPDAQTTRLNM